MYDLIKKFRLIYAHKLNRLKSETLVWCGFLVLSLYLPCIHILISPCIGAQQTVDFFFLKGRRGGSCQPKGHLITPRPCLGRREGERVKLALFALSPASRILQAPASGRRSAPLDLRLRILYALIDADTMRNAGF